MISGTLARHSRATPTIRQRGTGGDSHGRDRSGVATWSHEHQNALAASHELATAVIQELEKTVARANGIRARVLIVEDSEDQRELMRTYFERAKCEVVAVENAEDAIAEYNVETPDLAIIDLLLPGMNGWELVNRLRSDRPACAIVITSVLDVTDFPEAEGVLPKPFTRAQINQVLKDCVPE